MSALDLAIFGSHSVHLPVGKYNYSYDNEGNRTQRVEIATGEITQYSWDYRNRLTRVIVKDAAGNVVKAVEYTYDAFDRRIAKEVDPDGHGAATSEVERFVYDNEHIALTFDGDGNLTHRYLHSPVVDQVIADENATGSTLWTLADNLGTVRDLVDDNGTVLNHITYDSFGNVINQTNSAINTRFGYTGRDFDGETGLNYYRARYYDAAVGRFISQDPIGFNGGDLNLYRYVTNSPTNATDPTGLIPITFPLPLFKPFVLPKTGPIIPPVPVLIPQNSVDPNHPRLTPQNPKTRKPLIEPGSIPVINKPKQDPNLECKCPKPYPIFEVDGKQFPNHARMVSAAKRLRPGEWDILSYKKGVNKKNRQEMKAYWEKQYGKASDYGNYDWDEYPYASSLEGGEGAYAELTPSKENRDAGNKLNNFLKKNFVTRRLEFAGCKFKVQVINYEFNSKDPQDIPEFIGDPVYNKVYPQLPVIV